MKKIKVYCKDCKFGIYDIVGTWVNLRCDYEEINHYNETIKVFGAKRNNNKGNCRYYQKRLIEKRGITNWFKDFWKNRSEIR